MDFLIHITDLIDKGMFYYANPTDGSINSITDEKIDEAADEMKKIVTEYAVAYINEKSKTCKEMAKKYREIFTKEKE